MSRPSKAVRHWLWLLALPYLAGLFPQLYARTDPTLFGMPFFYWYQIVLVIASTVCMGIVYYATR